MKIRFLYFSLFLAMLLVASCTKRTIINETEYVDVIVGGNEAPPYSSVTTVQIQGYVNRMFIDLLGREPSTNERDQITLYLKDNELNGTARDFVLGQLMASQEYYNRFFTVYVEEFLDGITEQQVDNILLQLNFFKTTALNAGNTLLAQQIQIEINRTSALKTVLTNYKNGTSTINEFFAILINNTIYDDINMGSENFVNACFEGLFKRLPTDTELNAGVTMVDGFSAQLLLKDGNNKTDFINIVTSIDEFYQGLVIDIYSQLMARLPNSQEMGEGTIELATTQNYQLLQRKVMKTDEYAGF